MRDFGASAIRTETVDRMSDSSFEMSSVGSGDAKARLNTALAAAEKQAKSLSSIKGKLSDVEKQVKATLQASAELLIADVKKHLAKGSYSTVAKAVKSWRQQRAAELQTLENLVEGGNLNLVSVVALVGYLDDVGAIAGKL